MLTIVLFFFSSAILHYVPTIIAATLVLFLGIELMTEALWESAKKLTLYEWIVVFGTLLSCTFLGFAPGIAIGIGLAMILYVGLSVAGSVGARLNMLISDY